MAQLGVKGFSASAVQEKSPIFSPEGSHHEQFDEFGLFHASADAQLDPPAINPSDAYNDDAFARELASSTQPGELNTWLIEEVEWSGRACQYQPRLTSCNGAANRENNTVFLPRWKAWMQLLDYIHDYPDGVAMTLGDVALAKTYDNARRSRTRTRRTRITTALAT